MARKGICGICGKGGKLTEEHIPPECAGNVHGLAQHTLADWLTAEGDPDRMQNGQPRPNGSIWITLCERCNNEVLGSWYVPDFCKFVQGVTASLRTTFRSQPELLAKREPMWCRIKTMPLRPLCIVKVIAGMVLALNAGDYPDFREQHQPLADFVLNKDAPLPAPYRAYVAISITDYATFAPVFFRGDITRPSEAIALSAVEHPPLAYLLTLNEPEPDVRPFLPLGGLHNLAQAKYDTEGRVYLDLHVGFRDTPVPGEYGQAKFVWLSGGT